MSTEIPSSTARMPFNEALPRLGISGSTFVGDASADGVMSRAGRERYFELGTPDCRFFCEECGGYRNFYGSIPFNKNAVVSKAHLITMRYACRDCRQYERVLVIRVFGEEEAGHAHITKIAEWPRHGEPIESSLLKSLGDWAPLFEKGVQSEHLGLGAGAFTYYRATVEHSFRSLLANVEQILRNEGADAIHIEKIQRASKENQFKKAVDLAKDHLPPGLMVSGQNPLTLLHGLFSYDLHAADDQGALEKAEDMRRLLTLLVDRIRTSIEHHNNGKASLARLLKAQQTIRTKPS